MPSKWALSAVIYYIKIDNKTQIQRPNFRNARNMCVDWITWHGLAWSVLGSGSVSDTDADADSGLIPDWGLVQ